jgi:predicted ATP-grasp superfamily ATP-dependent carboligase
MRRGRVTLGQYLRRNGSTESALLAVDDPVPALIDVPMRLRRTLTRG